MPFYLDHSQRKTWETCKRYYLLRTICGLTKPRKSAGLDFGQMIHAITEIYDKWDDLQMAMDYFTENYANTQDKVRTAERARTLLEAYAIFRDQKRYNYVFNNTGMEHGFEFEIAPGIMFSGRVDRVLADSIGEFKTTYYLYDSFGSPYNFLYSWYGHNSIRGYAVAMGAKTCHLVGFGVYPQKDKATGKYLDPVQSIEIPIYDWEKDEWWRETTAVADEIFSAYVAYDLTQDNEEENLAKLFSKKLHHHFPTHTGACNLYNRACQFKELCTRDIPEGYVLNNYTVEPFKPWLMGVGDPEDSQ